MLIAEELISIIVHQYYNTTHRYIAKTKLLKLAYLVELSYYRKFRERLTDIDWIYYKFGPYTYEYDSILEKANIEFADNDEDKHFDAILVKPIDEEQLYQYLQSKITFDVKTLIRNVLSDFSLMDLPELLDFIYFETEPMQNAENRGEKLDFSHSKNSSDYVVKPLSIQNEIIQSIKDKYKGRIENARRF